MSSTLPHSLLPAAAVLLPPQPFPHTSFEHEAFFLRQHFGHLGNGGSAYVLGDMFNGLQWHVYVADANGAVYADELHPLAKPTHKLEVCMTDLGKQAARAFFRDPAKSASQVRACGMHTECSSTVLARVTSS
jgi:hypothetical protein